jgi:hypothetical protein
MSGMGGIAGVSGSSGSAGGNTKIGLAVGGTIGRGAIWGVVGETGVGGDGGAGICAPLVTAQTANPMRIALVILPFTLRIDW